MFASSACDGTEEDDEATKCHAGSGGDASGEGGSGGVGGQANGGTGGQADGGTGGLGAGGIGGQGDGGTGGLGDGGTGGLGDGGTGGALSGPCTREKVSSCAGEQICIDGTCTAAFGRSYTFSIGEAHAPEHNRYGATWDSSGGLPDLYAVLLLDQEVLFTTSVVTDALTADLSGVSAEALLPAGAHLQVVLMDEDLLEPETVLICNVALDADALHAGKQRCGDENAYVDVFFAPVIQP